MDGKIILKKPLITEKSSKISEEQGQYTFIVNAQANKVEIRKAIEKMYNVTVESVNTMNYSGKPKTRYTKSKVISGHTPNYKKAVITTAKGEDGEREIIDFYDNI